MKFYILTLFPDMIKDGLSHSIIKRACNEGTIRIETIDIRDFSNNKHRHIDDYPYGGGAGMVMQPQPIYDAYMSIKPKLSENCPVVYMTPQGKTFNQEKAKNLSKLEDMVILCGHYEGVDERVIEEIVTDEISIGDFVLTGGELAAMTVIDAVARLIPGVLNKEESFQEESFSDNLLEYPQYTRPPEFMGRKVPAVLLSGHHQNIEKWRKEKSLERTKAKRPDLLEKDNI
ncbi:MAG: tRNA (guanosine(37)-N1)-methyltransferase TrmD [Eubacterium sp.]|nr:tRNA (guanosine(37)-N1)-methyltransferase TrmD [Eubacterium sp.]